MPKLSPIKRITQEYNDLRDNPPVGYFAEPEDSDNMYKWKGYVIGPEDTPFAGGKFKLSIEFPTDYPFSPPGVKFKTKVYHPNVSSSGSICVDILKTEWSPALTISKVLVSIITLLDEPNPNDPLRGNIANEYKYNREAYNQNVIEWTEKYAK